MRDVLWEEVSVQVCLRLYFSVTKLDMGRKRVSNEGAVGSSKRARLGETVANDDEDENVDSMSEDEGPADCSQRPDFIPPGETVRILTFMC